MKKTRYRIIILRGGEEKSYSAEFQTAEKFEQRWQGVLKKHHGHDALMQCGCPGTGDTRFMIKLRRDSGRYYVARFGHSGINHFPECIWYSSASVSGRQSYTEGVVEEEPDGTLRVKLALSLKEQEPVDRPARTGAGEPRQRSGRNQSVMKLQGLLSLLWTEAQLNVWYPAMAGKRFTGSVHGWLNAAASKIRAGRTNLSDVLLIGAQEDSVQESSNRKKLLAAANEKKRLVVITSLASWSKEREEGGNKIPVRDFFGLPELIIHQDLWKESLMHHPVERAAWERGARIIVIALTDAAKGNKTEVQRMALMYVSERWIPLDSSHEGIVESKLAAESRSFMKPMRFDAAEDDVFADFHLLDTSTNHLPMEVFGMGTGEYLLRKSQKQTFYNEKYGSDGWWYWDAYSSPSAEAMPPFPPAGKNRGS